MNIKSKILFSTIPKLTRLKRFIVTINFAENDCSKFLTPYNQQKIIARRLIEICDDILAAPVDGEGSHINLIISEELYENQGNLQCTMDSLQLILNGPYPLHNAIYLQCIRFTLNVKLSSEWNQIQNYFVKSGIFLKKIETHPSIRLHLMITDGCLGICPIPLDLRMTSISLIDFGIDFPSFFKKGFSKIRQKVYTLPNLKPAMALGVYSQLPKYCPFKNYSEIREYWKIMYGYLLPETDEGMLYVEVTFGWNNFLYIYPIICIYPHEPMQLPSNIGFHSVAEFLKAVEENFPKLCGHPLEIKVKSENLFQPISNLQSASEVKHIPHLINKSPGGSYDENNNSIGVVQPTSLENNISDCSEQSSWKFSSGDIPQLSLPKTLDETFICYETLAPKKKQVNNFPSVNPRQVKRIKTSENDIFENKEKNTKFAPVLCRDNISRGEIETSARMNNLEIHTIANLKNFCKDNNINFKCKEKKDTLMKKIYAFFEFH